MMINFILLRVSSIPILLRVSSIHQSHELICCLYYSSYLYDVINTNTSNDSDKSDKTLVDVSTQLLMLISLVLIQKISTRGRRS